MNKPIRRRVILPNTSTAATSTLVAEFMPHRGSPPNLRARDPDGRLWKVTPLSYRVFRFDGRRPLAAGAWLSVVYERVGETLVLARDPIASVPAASTLGDLGIASDPQIFAARRAATASSTDADAEFFDLYDEQTFLDGGATSLWRDPVLNATLLPAAIEQRRLAIQRVGALLDTRLHERGEGKPVTQLPAVSLELQQQVDLIRLLHEGLFARFAHFQTNGTLDAATIGTAYLRFANAELAKTSPVGNANYKNGLPNGAFVLQIGELAFLLAQPGVDSLWARLVPYFAAIGPVYGNAFYHLVPRRFTTYGPNPSGRQLSAQGLQQVAAKFDAWSAADRELHWQNVLRVVAGDTAGFLAQRISGFSRLRDYLS